MEPPKFYLDLYAEYSEALDIADRAIKETKGSQFVYDNFIPVRRLRIALDVVKLQLMRAGYTNLP